MLPPISHSLTQFIVIYPPHYVTHWTIGSMSTESTAQKSPLLAGTSADSEIFNSNFALKVGSNVTLALGADALLINGRQ